MADAETRELVVPDEPDRVKLVDYLRVIWRYRWLVFGFVLLALLAAFLYSTLTPLVFEATATILPPKEGTSAALGGLASGLLQQVQTLAGGSTGPTNSSMFLGILRSWGAAHAVTLRFDLRTRYEVPYIDDAVKRLILSTDISVSRDGVIAVKISDWDPWIAAQMANFYTAYLDRLVNKQNMADAGRQRGFIDFQLAKTKTALEKAEEDLRRFQEKNRAIVLPVQTQGAIEAAARLKGELIAAEVQLQVTRTFMTDISPDVVALKKRISELNRHLGELQYGDAAFQKPAPRANGNQRDFLVPFARVPEVGLELARLMRDAKIQETVFTLLTQQFEQAKITENKDVPVVQVLDTAAPPERFTRPRVWLNLAAAGVGGLFVGLYLPFGVEHARKLRREWKRRA